MQILARLGLVNGGSGGGAAARLSAAAPAVVSVVLVVALAAQLASLAWKLLVPPQPQAPPADVAAPAQGPNVVTIVQAHLFGSAAPQGGQATPNTNLRLTLAGTLAGPDPAVGWAIIGESAQAARLYATGASLPGGARLKEVYADRVILDRGGKLEALPLPRLAGGAALPVAYSQPARQPTLAESVQNLVRQNPGAVSEIIRPQPVFSGGQQKGYRVYPGRNRAQFASLGLMPGDLVTAVNGTPLDDPNRGLETLRGIGAGGAVTLTIERNGSQQQVTIDASAAAAGMQADTDSQPAADSSEQE
jgi:general secretion pathway protein C